MEDLYFLDKFRAEPNMTLLLNTWFTGVDKAPASEVLGESCGLQDGEGGALVCTAYATNQITQETFVITCKCIIDTTGDGRVMAEAQADWTQGREASSTYGESMAPPEADTLTEGTSLAFHAVNMGRPMPFKLPPTFTRRFQKSDFDHRYLSRLDYGYWWVELSFPWDTVSDGETIRKHLSEALLGVWDYMKNSGEFADKGIDNYALNWFGWYPCKREARRLVGMHV